MPLPLVIDCDTRHGFAFASASKSSFGFLYELSFGDTLITADMLGADPLHELPSALPLKPGAGINQAQRGSVFKKAMVGVLEKLSWEGGHADSLELSFLVSVATWGKLDVLFRTEIDTNTKVKFCLSVFKWDYVNNAYFIRFCTDGGATDGRSPEPKSCQGYIYSSDTMTKRAANKSLSISIGAQPEKEDSVGGFLAYRVTMMLEPPSTEKAQYLRVCTSQKNKAAFRWFEKKSLV